MGLALLYAYRSQTPTVPEVDITRAIQDINAGKIKTVTIIASSATLEFKDTTLGKEQTTLQEPDTLMALWIALEDTDRENGCLAVVPGSHTDPIHPVETPEEAMQAKIYRITAVGAKQRTEVQVPLKAGSGVFFTGHVLHRSGHNRSARHRRAYVLHYADARSKWLNDPKAVHPHLLVAGQEYPGGL